MPLADYWQRIAAVVDALPGGCVGVAAKAQAIAWPGKEQIGECSAQALVEDRRAGLEAIAENHAAHAAPAP